MPVPLAVRTPSKVVIGFLFALIGGLAVLFGLPLTRPFYTRIALPAQADKDLATTRKLAAGHPLPWPDSAENAALWLSLAAKRMIRNGDLQPQEIKDLQTISAKFAASEPDNGYWNQAAAAFALDGGDAIRARALWIKASHSLSWNSHETNLLLGPFDQREPIPGSIYADLIDLRNESIITHLQDSASKLIAFNWADPAWSSQVRAATVLNGDLIRSHVRSLFGMNAGIQIVDLSLVRPGAPMLTGHHQLLVSRLDLEREVRDAKVDLAGHNLERIFNESDSAVALTTREDTNARGRTLATEAAVADTLPGAILLSAAFALVAVFLKYLFIGVEALDKKVPWLGTGLAATAALLLSLKAVPNFVALAFALCIVFRGSTPANVRKLKPNNLGRLHDAYIGFTALLIIACGATVFLFASASSGPRLRSLLPSHFDWHASGYGMFLLVYGGVFLTAPLWAYVQRLPTAFVLDVSLRRLWKATAVLALFLAVVFGPVSLLVERTVQPQLMKIFVNEPIYYLSRQS